MELETLIARCREGDDLAWEAVVRGLQGRIFGITLHYFRDREEARDAAQDIFIRLYERLHTFRNESPFLPWLLRLARNCCIDRLRRLQVRTPAISVSIENAAEIDSKDPTPEEGCLESARHRLIYRALGKLNETNREMILLKDIQGLKQDEIAVLLGLPVGTVKSRSMRARIELGNAVRTLMHGAGSSVEQGI